MNTEIKINNLVGTMVIIGDVKDAKIQEVAEHIVATLNKAIYTLFVIKIYVKNSVKSVYIEDNAALSLI
jgi:hypothetical protein